MPEIGGQLVPVAQVQVQTAQLVIVAVAVQHIDDVIPEPVDPAGGIGLRIVLQVIQGHRIQTAGGDDVVGKGRACHAG